MENAIQKWVRESSGLPGKLCRWWYERGDRPTETYISLQLDALGRSMHDWKSTDDAPELDAWVADTEYSVGDQVTNADRAYECITAGESDSVGGPSTTAADITDGAAHWEYLGEGAALPGSEVRVRARGLRTMQLALECFASASEKGNVAMQTLADVMAGLELAIADLDDGGVGIGDVGAVQYVAGGSKLLTPRARFEITIHLASEVESRTTYIEYVETRITETSTGDTFTVWSPTDPPAP